MRQKTHLLLGLPEANHWSKLFQSETLKGRFWLFLAVVGDQAPSVGKELVEVLKQTKVVDEADLYQALLKLQNVALDNQVRLSLAGAFLSLKRWTFFSLNALVGIKRQDKPLRWVLAQLKLEPSSLVGVQREGDLIFFATGRLAQDPAVVRLALDQSRFRSRFLTLIYTQIRKQKCFVSDGLVVIDLDKQLAPLNFTVKAKADSVTRTPAVNESKNNLTPRGLAKMRLRVVLHNLTLRSKTFLSWSRLVLTRFHRDFKIWLSLRKTPKTMVDNRVIKQAGEAIKAVKLDELITRSKQASRFGRASKLPRRLELEPESKVGVGFRLGGARLRRHRLLFSLFMVLLSVLLIGGLFFFWQSKKKHREQAIRQQLAPHQTQLRRLQVADRTLLPKTRDEAKKLLEKLKVLQASYPANSLEAKLVQEQIQATNAFLETVASSKELESLPIYLDISSFSADFVISDAAFTANKLYLLDKTKKLLLVFDPALNQTNQFALVSLDKIKDLATYKDQALLLDNGVYGFDPAVTEPKSLIAASELVNSSTLVAAYGDFIYLYNPDEANIFRFGPKLDKEPKTWLKTVLGGKYNQVVSWVIDGDIWTGGQEGLISRYRAGRRLDFKLKGLPEPLAGPVYLATTTDINKLYVLAPEQDRVIELDKDGNFIKEVKNFVLGSAIGLVYEQKTNQVLAVSGSLVYRVPLE